MTNSLNLKRNKLGFVTFFFMDAQQPHNRRGRDIRKNSGRRAQRLDSWKGTGKKKEIKVLLRVLLKW